MGRRSMHTQYTTVADLGALIFSEVPKGDILFKPSRACRYREVRYARDLLEALWSKPLMQGATNESYMSFLHLSLKEKLQILTEDGFAVMCQGF